MINQFLRGLFSLLPNWLGILLFLFISFLALLLAVLLSFIFLRLIDRIQWKDLTIWRKVHITNQGNVKTTFNIQAISAGDLLKIDFLYQGKPLEKVKIPIPANSVRKIEPATPLKLENKNPKPEMNVDTPKQEPSGGGNIKKEADSVKQAAAKTADDAKKQAEDGLGKVKGIGTILGTLGGLLPGSLGEKFKEKSNAIQSQSQSAGATIKIPEEKMKTVEALKGQVKNVAPDKKPAVPELQNSAKSVTLAIPSDHPTETNPSYPPASQPGKGKSEDANDAIQPYETWFQSPEVVPGEVLDVDMQIGPVHKYRTQDYHFWVTIQQVLPEKAALNKPSAQKRIAKTVAINGISSFIRAFCIFMDLVIVSINGVWVVLLVRWLMRFIS
jgi:hypothetical protein